MSQYLWPDPPAEEPTEPDCSGQCENIVFPAPVKVISGQVALNYTRPSDGGAAGKSLPRDIDRRSLLEPCNLSPGSPTA
jgi:hypothetical protein